MKIRQKEFNAILLQRIIFILSIIDSSITRYGWCHDMIMLKCTLSTCKTGGGINFIKCQTKTRMRNITRLFEILFFTDYAYMLLLRASIMDKIRWIMFHIQIRGSLNTYISLFKRKCWATSYPAHRDIILFIQDVSVVISTFF